MPGRRWKTVEDLRPHLDPIVTELGRMPTHGELSRHDLGFLIDAMQKFGGPGEVARVLGYPHEGRKSWASIDDVQLHLEPFVAELGRMPKYSELKRNRRHDLINAIQKFGGYQSVAEQLGFAFMARHSWRAVDDLRLHLDPFVRDLGRMPFGTELKRQKRHDLLNAIPKFGGYATVAEALGYPYQGPSSWKRIEDLRDHLDPIVAELGRMPTQRELVARNRTDIVGAISKLGGIAKVAHTLKVPHSPPRRWNRVDDLLPYLDPIVAELRRMPGPVELGDRGLGALSPVVYKFGGFRAVAEALEYEPKDRQAWRTVEDLRPHLNPLVAQTGRMPSTPELLAVKRTDLIGAIGKFGGSKTVATALGYEYTGPRSWKSVEDLRPYLDPIVAELGRLPTIAELTARDAAFLNDAMHKFGGKLAVAQALGYPYKSKRTWTSPDELRPFLDPMVQELGRMPSLQELDDRGRSHLRVAIGKFGGLAGVAEALRYPYDAPKSWSSLEVLRRELDPIVAEIGRMPTKPELVKRGRYDITNAIRKFGGQRGVAEALGYRYEVRRRIWDKVEDLRPHLDPLVAELGHMPSVTELTKRRLGGLMGPIRKFGGPAAVAASLTYPYDPPRYWQSVEDLRPDLDAFVARLGRMPTKSELISQGRFDVRSAIMKFGGAATVAEALGYPFEFAPALERHQRLKELETALVELHESQLLSAGQVMLILRHAGLLSMRRVADVLNRLPITGGAPSGLSGIDLGLTATTEVDGDDAATGPAGIVDDPSTARQSTPIALIGDAGNAPSDGDNGTDIAVPGPGRDRTAEIRELRGWSHLGNLLDPAPALVQLSVTRLKIAFYRFANEVRGSLAAPTTSPSPDELERMEDELWGAAFGEYGDFIDNDLVHAACDAYIADLASALLVPRHETDFVPRL